MLRLTELRLPLDHGSDALSEAAAARLGVAVRDCTVFRRGFDARRRGGVVLVYTADVSVDDEAAVLARHAGDARIGPRPIDGYEVPRPSRMPNARPVVVGAGPCGLFAALLLAKMGLRPIVIERGRVVRERTKDTWGLWRRGVLDPESNVQFGEGGAGTFSDGKLYSGIGDPGHRGRFVLEAFVEAGAPPEILWVSKPHIGTFRLVGVVEAMRATIERLGGEYRFETRVEDLLVSADGARLQGLLLSDGTELAAEHVVLATGHSARSTLRMLHRRGVRLDAKPFSVGVRIEHPQGLIDRARFGAQAGHQTLGAADYKLVHHAKNGRSAYSFCMCPGGTVVAATSEPGRVVTNGMSQYSRNERNANAGIVVGVEPRDFADDPDWPGPLAGIGLQRTLEAAAFVAGGRTYAAPAQTVGDFLAGRASASLGDIVPSYRPGVTPTDLADCLPAFVVDTIREALPVFGRRIAGFDTADAVMTGVETRTSCPVRITRGPDGQSMSMRGLFPAGEGAGYAGGILSAGVDGLRAAEAVAAALS